MAQSETPKVYVYIGTYTRRDSQGIHIFTMDPATGDLTPVGAAESESPSFLALHPNKQFLYAVNETGQFQGQPTGAVSAFARDPETGELTFLNQQISHGTSPAHITIDDAGTYLYVANYGTGTAAVFPVGEDGRLGEAGDVVQHEGSGSNPRRQEGPHAHSVTLDPTQHYAYVADLGIDKLMVYNISETPGRLTPNAVPYVEVAGGSGPRHFAFDPSGRFAYLINEMGNTITAFEFNAENGDLKTLQTVPTLPEDFDGNNSTADIHVDPTGMYVYGSNRGHNSIVIYKIDRDAGTLTLVDHVESGGKTPRNFGIDPTGAYVLVANQDSDNVVVFRRDPDTGKLTPTGAEVSVSMPVCVKFLVH